MDNLIIDVKTGLLSLKEYVLLRVSFDNTLAFYIWKNNKILVITKKAKYFISKETFSEEFSLFRFYLYKRLQDFDIEEELFKFQY